MNEKIQKILSKTGYGSRRWIEKMIVADRITINQENINIGQRFSIYDIDTVTIDKDIFYFDKTITYKRVIIYHKPNGEICTRKDPKNRTTVFQKLPYLYNAQWISIGRLDINTTGLLLFTTDGCLANRLMHPKFNIVRKYAVCIFGHVSKSMLKKLTTGVKIKDGYASFKEITLIKSNKHKKKWFIVSLSEGRNREVRRIWNSVGIIVHQLIRIQYGNIKLPKKLLSRTWIDVNLKQMHYLYKSVQLIY